MKLFSYVVARDYGFAPNPFGGICSLATCKPGIRKRAEVKDWVVGTGATHVHGADRLVFAMRIGEKITFDEYWADKRFLRKRPVMNGSLKRMYGDNIYYKKHGQWHQADSHHSRDDGTPNQYNLRRDTSCVHVLLSDYFCYFGKEAPCIPVRFRPDKNGDICKKGPGYKSNFSEGFVERFVHWVMTKFAAGYYGDPAWFARFERYDGVS